MSVAEAVLAAVLVLSLALHLYESNQHRLEVQRYQRDEAKLVASFLSHTTPPYVASTYQTYEPEPEQAIIVEEREAESKPVGL